jgi:hypothetical protein
VWKSRVWPVSFVTGINHRLAQTHRSDSVQNQTLFLLFWLLWVIYCHHNKKLHWGLVFSVITYVLITVWMWCTASIGPYWQNSSIISCTHTVLIQLIKLASEHGFWFLLSTVHTFSIMFKPGLPPGHGSSSGMPFCFRQDLAAFMPWHGAQYCWKWLLFSGESIFTQFNCCYKSTVPAGMWDDCLIKAIIPKQVPNAIVWGAVLVARKNGLWIMQNARDH